MGDTATSQGNQGILLINNLHLGTQRPALRFDDNFFDTVSKKLHVVLEKARNENLTPVFCGVFTQKSWDTALFSYLVKTFQEAGVAKPFIVLDEPMMQRNGLVRPNSMAEVLSLVGSAFVVDQADEKEVGLPNSSFILGMSGPGLLTLRHAKAESGSVQTLIHSDTVLPSLVRVRLDEKDKASSVLRITEDSVEEITIDSGTAPIDDVAFDIAEEIKTFDSQLVERLRALMKKDDSTSEHEGDADLKNICEELKVTGDVRNILFELKDEVSAEDL